MMRSSTTDWLGTDPYKLRVNKREAVVKPDASLHEIIMQHNLWPNPTLPPADTNPKPNKVSDYVHVTWLGEREIGATEIGKENILSWKKQNPEKPVIVWTNTVNPCTGQPFPKEVMDEKINWCRENNIMLLDVDDVFAGRMSLEAAYLRELLKPNYGSASDILRLFILKLFGGIHTDIDIACIKSLGEIFAPKGIRINSAPRAVSSRFKGSFQDNTLSTMNDLIMAVPHSKEIDRIIEKIHSNYTKKAKDLFIHGVKATSMGEAEQYSDVAFKLHSQQLYRELTIGRTGPGVLCLLYGHNYHEVSQKMGEDFIVNPTYFEFQQGRTWLDKKSMELKPMNPADVVKQILSNIIADLDLEDPRILRMDLYAKLIKEYNLGNSLMQEFAKSYPQYAAKIKYVHFNHCLRPNDPTSAACIDTLFDKQNFPNLSRDPELYREYYPFIKQLEKQGIKLSSNELLEEMLDTCEDIETAKTVIKYYQEKQLPLIHDGKSLLESALTYPNYYGKGQPFVVAALLEMDVKAGLNKGLEQSRQVSLAHWAVENAASRGPEIFKALIECCVKHNLPLDIKNKEGHSPVLALGERHRRSILLEDSHVENLSQALDYFTNVIHNRPSNPGCTVS